MHRVIKYLIMFVVLAYIAIPATADEVIRWENTKTITHAKLNMTAPQEFNTCIISPDGGSGWDTCTAYIIVGNNFQHLPTGQLNFNSVWRKGNVRNVQYQYTKVFYDTVITNPSINGEPETTIPAMGFAGFSSSIPSVNTGEYFAVKIIFEKKRWTTDFFDFRAQAGSDSITLDPDVAACGTLNTAGSTYTLIADLTQNSGACLVIAANNILVDGNGHTINYAVTAAGHGISITTTQTNISIKNINFVQATAAGVSNAIVVSGASIITGLNITNNIITTNGGNGNGININPSAAVTGVNISENVLTCTSYCIITRSLASTFRNSIIQNNTISGGISFQIQRIDQTDIFINNSFSTPTSIYFTDTTPVFNMSNGTGQPYILSNVSAIIQLQRRVFNWNVTNITTNDSVYSGTVRLNYSAFGLIPNRHYRIYNNSYLNFTLLSNSTGAISLFPMNLTTNALNVSILANNIPIISNVSSSYTIQSQTTLTIVPTITDSDGDIISLNSTNATFGTFNPSTGALTFTPEIDQTGTYYWNITATDSLGDSTTSSFILTVVNTPYQTSCNNTNNDVNIAFELVGVLLIVVSAFGTIATIKGNNMIVLVSFVGVGVFGSLLLLIGIFITSTISNGLC